MKLSKQLVYLLAFTAMMFVMPGCDVPANPGIYKNGQIESGKREAFHKFNDELFAGCKGNKPKDVEVLMDKEMLLNGGYLRNIELISLQSKLGAYELLDEYYIVSDKANQIHTLNTKALDGTEYSLYCRAAAFETYMAFLVPKTKADKYIITAVYRHQDYGWKLSTLDFQPYTVMGKTAPQLYELAKQKLANGYIIDAITTMQMIDKVIMPNDYWLYPQKGVINKYEGKLIGIFNNTYTFPLTMSQVSTKPKVFNIETLTLPEGVFPDVYYQSTINLNDTTSLKKENDEVKKVIGKLFPGIDKDKKYICFSVYNEKPTSKRNTLSYDITARLP